MSFTKEGMARVIAGLYPNQEIEGRIGVHLIELEPNQISMRFFILAEKDNVVLFEYDPIPMVEGQQVMLNGAKVVCPIEIVRE